MTRGSLTKTTKNGMWVCEPPRLALEHTLEATSMPCIADDRVSPNERARRPLQPDKGASKPGQPQCVRWSPETPLRMYDPHQFPDRFGKVPSIQEQRSHHHETQMGTSLSWLSESSGPGITASVALQQTWTTLAWNRSASQYTDRSQVKLGLFLSDALNG